MGGKPADTVITLTVDTDNIQPNEQSIKDNVVFSDNQSDPAENPGHPDKYVSTVNKGKTCTWQGVAKNKRDTVNITVVAKKPNGGADILSEITLGDPISDPKVTSTVKSTAVSGDESYSVTFIINKNPTPAYTVDPRLKMNN